MAGSWLPEASTQKRILNSAELYGPASSPGTIGPGLFGAWYDPRPRAVTACLSRSPPDSRFYAACLRSTPAGTQQAWFTGVGTYSGNTASIATGPATPPAGAT